MRRLIALGGALAFVVAAAVAVPAYGPPAPQEGPFPVPQPTEEHKALAREVGAWNATIKSYMAGPDAPPQESSGVEFNRLMTGGLWLISDFRGDFGGQPFQGHGTTGFDTNKKKFVGSWADSMSVGLMVLEGTHDPAAHTMTMVGESTGPDGQPAKMKIVSTQKDDNTRHSTMYMVQGDQDIKVMEISYTRMSEDEAREARKKAGARRKGGAGNRTE